MKNDYPEGWVTKKDDPRACVGIGGVGGKVNVGGNMWDSVAILMRGVDAT